MTGSALVIGMDRSLIGREILLADLYGTKKHLASGCEEEGDFGLYIIIALLVIFKGEMG